MYSDLLPNEPVIMPWQSKPFNNDHFVCEKFLELKLKFNCQDAIECGSAMGGTTKWLGENFDRVYTTEINSEFQKFAFERTKYLPNITHYLSDTVNVLAGILMVARNPIIFLDDHWLENLPLMDELRIIAESGLKPVIAIHDFKVPGHSELGFDSYDGQDFEWSWIRWIIESIYGFDGYRIEYNTTEKSAGAKRGILYITPKQ